jgi:hypothetical protein
MRTSACIACVTLLAALIGCGGSGLPRTVQLGGTVTLDGKPLSNALIFFAAADRDGAAPVVAQVTDGRFAAPIVPQGRYRVTFRPSDFLGTEPTGPVGSNFGTKSNLRESKSPLPDKYREQFETIDATADKLDLKFELTTK